VTVSLQMSREFLHPTNAKQHIFITGGFSVNPYLFRKVKEWAKKKTIEVERGDDP